MLTLDDVRKLADSPVFKLTRAEAEVVEGLGGYTATVNGPVLEALESMEDEGALARVARIAGLAHSPDWSRIAACSFDGTVWRFAENVTALTEAEFRQLLPTLEPA